MLRVAAARSAGAALALRASQRTMHTSKGFTSVDPADVAHFTRLSQHWWDEDGEFALLHKMNRARIDFMRQKLAEVQGWDAARAEVLGQSVPREASSSRFLESLEMLDVGCGGGLLCEVSEARVGDADTRVPLAWAHV